jgi:betaine reductase
MVTVEVKATSYCLVHAPEIGQRYGSTPYQEYFANPESPFLTALDKTVRAPGSSYDTACRYAPHLTYIGAMSTDALDKHARPCLEHLAAQGTRSGKYGEIMPEDEFIGLMDICDVFDLIWLDKTFAVAVKSKLAKHPLIDESQLKRLEEGHSPEEINAEVANNQALPLYFDGKVVGCCRRGHETDENLNAHVLLENLASKTGAVLALLHLIKNTGVKPEDIDFVVDCSEEAVGDMNQRGGGNMAKAIAESAGCSNASGFDLRAFCAAPVVAIITSAGMVAAGVHKNVAVVSGGSVPKLYMNSREHVKKNVTPLENVMGCFAVLLTPDEGQGAVIRLDSLGKHGVAAGASPQAVTTALVWEPLQAAGLTFTDVDKYAPELHNPEVTLPAGAGNVPEANFKMIAALAVMKGVCDKAAIPEFVSRHGMYGFAPTQGHIPSGVPYLGHAVDAINEGRINRAMFIGKGSLFLGRLTNLADGASFLLEKSKGAQAAGGQSVNRQDVETVILDVLADLAAKLKE